MKQLHNSTYNANGLPSDACPTCGAQISNKATQSKHGHTYFLECPRCSWSLPVTKPQRVPIADGGAAVSQPTENDTTARDILDELHYDGSVQRVYDALEGAGEELTPNDLRRTLALAAGELVLEFGYEGKTEYIRITDDWQTLESCYYRTGDAHVCGPVELEADDLETRLSNLTGVCLLADAPAVIGGEA